eukprot:6459834-Amphidinium_carterae.1
MEVCAKHVQTYSYSLKTIRAITTTRYTAQNNCPQKQPAVTCAVHKLEKVCRKIEEKVGVIPRRATKKLFCHVRSGKHLDAVGVIDVVLSYCVQLFRGLSGQITWCLSPLASMVTNSAEARLLVENLVSIHVPFSAHDRMAGVTRFCSSLPQESPDMHTPNSPQSMTTQHLVEIVALSGSISGARPP